MFCEKLPKKIISKENTNENWRKLKKGMIYKVRDKEPRKLNQNHCTLERLFLGPFCRFYVAYCKYRLGKK